MHNSYIIYGSYLGINHILEEVTGTTPSLFHNDDIHVNIINLMQGNPSSHKARNVELWYWK